MLSDPAKNVVQLDVRALNRVTLELHRISRELTLRQFQPAALEMIQDIVPFDSAWWGNASAEPMEIHQLYLFNCDDSILQAYLPYMGQDFFRAALMARPDITINMADLTTREDYVRSALYREVGARYKVEWSLGTLLVEPVSSLYEFLTLWRHDGENPFSETERQTKELLMPHLAQAHLAARVGEVLGEAREADHGWALVDERGFLREVTPAFVHCLREQWPDWQGSRLPPPLLESVRLATAFTTAHLKLKITPKGYFRHVQALALSPLDRLSPRERDIVNRYTQGRTYAEISMSLGLSSATVRNHIANCYRKLAVNSKAELVLRMSQAES